MTVPDEPPVTTPDEDPIVAVPVTGDTLQAPPGTGDDNVTVAPEHTFGGPTMPPTAGNPLTVNTAVL